MAALNAALPDGFRDLEPFLDWALHSEGERLAKRLSTSMDQIKRFYDAFLPRASAALNHLNDFPLDNLPEAEGHLFLIALGFIEAANAVEVFGQQQVIDGFAPERFFPMPELRPSAMGDGWA